MSIKKTQTEFLPTALIAAIDALQLKGTPKATAIQIVAAIIRLSRREHLTLEEFKTISAAYFREISHNYQVPFAALKAAGIVETYTNSKGQQYSTAASVAKAYRVNPDLISETEAEVKFSVNTERFRATNLTEPMTSWTRADLNMLQVDMKEAQEYIQMHLECLLASDWKVTRLSPEYALNSYSDNVRFGLSPNRYKYSIPQLIDQVLVKEENRGKNLFRQGNGFVIDTETAFLERKRKRIRNYWNRAIHSVVGRQFFVKRVESNSRIHTNITEFPKQLLSTVTCNGEPLVEIDIANSQMAALAHVMLHGDVLGEGIMFPPLNLDTGTTKSFISHCQGETIYSEVARMLGISRAVAKTEMFRVVFGGVNKTSKAWKQIKADFPAVAAWLETVKQLPDFNLAIYLQRWEAHVMIENVYPAIKNAGFVAFSKHDSFLVPQSQVAQVRALVEQVMRDMKYLATLKHKATPCAIKLVLGGDDFLLMPLGEDMQQKCSDIILAIS
ncbi:hypothetical protein [Hymenobacter convexus]|uniref:hypothetical protein n=1 Tax=Hymenobacter sp. CA1UV-4 TaxID=3063782 RepID=UPI002713DB47|nr:hypothetical protein [Hymenobacter sp. CA1UV-4]MDO7853427.1 hypothetical protein [Hymenobacter sp. CA1UV-4]